MTAAQVLGGAAAGLVVLGAVLIIAGLRPRVRADADTAVRAALATHTRARLLRTLGAAGLGLAAWTLSGWPALGVAATAAAVGLPAVVGADRRAQEQIARVEAVEEWARRVADVLAIGVAILLSRLIYATFALRALSRILELGGILRNSWKVLGERFKSSTSFAVDSGATNIFAQLDVILVNHLAGREAAGIYFAGSRLIQGAVPFSVLLASVHIPRFAYQLHNKTAGLARYGLRILGEYTGMGLIFALAFFFIGPLFTDYFLGAEYAELNTLWLAFACFTAARFIAAGLGVQLMAMGTGFLRTFGIIASGVITVLCYWIFIPSHGIQAAPWVSTLGMVVLTGIYGYAVLAIYRKRRQPA